MQLKYRGAADGGCPITFDPVSHEYRRKGKWLPGCTRILADQGYVHGARFFTPESRQRGKAAHWAVLLIDQHCPDATTLDEALEVVDLDERLHPFVSGYLAFKRDKRFRPVYHEVLVFSADHNVCGHFDIWGETPDGTRIVDLKTWKTQGPTVKRAAALQVAGYRHMTEECLGMKADVAEIVALPGDGTYREYLSEAPALDAMLFRYNCVIWWDRMAAGLIEGGKESEVEIAE
jgi:hypothetical protein